ncbi:hypothetical protein [Sandarakinorhabdus sp. DWP1-3-1]|uniref:hypothetical protein n=1 Tax=Sandarakinorhabdus sp. DWP1-3-1 TaxID=2804627 RepID=UPI003CEE7A8C
MNRNTIIALLAAAALSACGESASKSARDNAAMDETTAGMPVTTAPPSTDLPTAPAVPGNPEAAAGPGDPSAGTVTPSDDPAAYNAGAGNANLGPGNDGSAGTLPSGTGNQLNEPNPPPR